MDFHQSDSYLKYVKSLGWVVDQSFGFNAFIKKVPFLGSVIKIQRPAYPLSLDLIDKLAKKWKAIFVKIEPDSVIESYQQELLSDLAKAGFSRDNWPLLPTKSIRIDLTQSIEQIMKSLSKDTRYGVRKSECLKNYESDDILKFHQIIQETMKIGKWQIPIKKNILALYNSFSPSSKIIFIKEGEDFISGALLVFYEGLSHYMYAGSTKRGRSVYSAYRCLWEAIKLSKKMGCKTIDLEGIYDKRFPSSNKAWLGFTHFKQGFGGVEIEFPGSFIKYYSPIFALLFRLMR